MAVLKSSILDAYCRLWGPLLVSEKRSIRRLHVTGANVVPTDVLFNAVGSLVYLYLRINVHAGSLSPDRFRAVVAVVNPTRRSWTSADGRFGPEGTGTGLPNELGHLCSHNTWLMHQHTTTALGHSGAAISVRASGGTRRLISATGNGQWRGQN